MRKRKVIKNADNRHTLNQMSLRYNLFMLKNDIVNLMQGQMLQDKHLMGGIKNMENVAQVLADNVNVALEKLAKKAKINLKEESEEK